MTLPVTPTSAYREDERKIFSDHADWIYSVDSIIAQFIVDKIVSKPDGSAR